MPDAPDNKYRHRLEEIAGRLGEQLRLRTIPRLPFSLATDMVADEHYGKWVPLDSPGRALAVYPFWNRVVELLDQGRGYTAVLLLLERLTARHDALESRLEPAVQRQGLLEAVLSVLTLEALETTSDAAVGSGPDFEDNPVEREWWRWEQSESAPGAFLLKAPRLAIEDDVLFSVDAAESWGSALDRVEKELRSLEWVRLEERRRDMVAFQLRVVGHVLDQFEVLGHVETLDPERAEEFANSPPDIDNLSPDQLLTVVVAGPILDRDPDGEVDRNPLLREIDREIHRLTEERVIPSGPPLKWYLGKAKRVAISLGAYREHDGDTDEKPTAEKRRAERAHFGDVVVQLRETVRLAGVETVADVVDEVRRRSL